MSAPFVTLATSTTATKEDFDLAPLVDALARAGVTTRVRPWDDPTAQAEFQAARLCLLRSTWNYVHHLPAFLAWTETVAAATQLWNPAPVVRWNSHKAYLQELEAQGIPIVPTLLLPRGSAPTLRGRLGDWQQLVIKPAVGAGSFATVRVEAADLGPGEAHLQRLLPHRDMLVQRYEPAVEGSGERSLVWIDGRFTHAVRKQARFTGDQEQVSNAAVPIADDERALAERILDRAPGPRLYARVDLVRDREGQPRLMELELIEPSLFFAQGPGSVERLAAAVRQRL